MKKAGKLFSFFFLGIFSLFLSVQIAQACSCVKNETVDKDFLRVPNIAVFKLQTVERYAEGETGYGYGGVKQAKLTVEKVFKGNLKVGQTLTFAQGGGGDCIWTFNEKSIGQEYLFYLGDKPFDGKSNDRMTASTSSGANTVSQAVWVAPGCSRSGNVKYRIGDIKYLENASKLRDKTRFSGILSQSIAAATEDEEDADRLLSGYKITIKGNGKNLELKTDENGFYEIYDLPPGKYTATPEKIIGYKALYDEKDSLEIEIKPKSHTEQNFYYRISNRVSGKFYDTNGKPLKDVCLKLEPVRGKAASSFYQSDCTKSDGSFEFETIPAGTYLLVINDDGEISSDEPFGTFYYPNALKREDAAGITIDAGYFRDDLIITAPQTAETITISGVVSFEKGTAPSKENYEYMSVKFVSETPENKTADVKKEIESRAKVDENGRFTIRILKGQKGKLYGELMSYVGEYENCPKLDKLLRMQKVEIGATVMTNSIEVEAETDLIAVELKFPFPSCKKEKVD